MELLIFFPLKSFKEEKMKDFVIETFDLSRSYDFYSKISRCFSFQKRMFSSLVIFSILFILLAEILLSSFGL
jgi:hypothetical protein